MELLGFWLVCGWSSSGEFYTCQQLYSARLEVVMDRRALRMFLGLAPDFAVEEGSKDEPEGWTSGGRVGDVSDLNSEHLLSHTQLCAESIINQSS